jgi:hypothetical protein
MLKALRFKRLISAGYFPAELPPPFTAANYANHANTLSNLWSENEIFKFRSSPEHFSIPRHGKIRRKLSIVNPINQLLVSRLVADNWIEIRKRIVRSGASEFLPSIRLGGGGRAVNGVNFDAVSRKRVQILAQYGRYVATDIARFYTSIYTHSIPWALYGKDWAKANLKSPEFRNSLGNKLDQAVQAGQNGQTIGIPIGPDTSRILAEIVASEIEQLTKVGLPDFDQRATRYVDDVIIGFGDTETPEEILSKFSAALYQYELELNGAKTQLHGLGHSHNSEWRHFIRSFRIASSLTRQREDLDSYFEQALQLAEGNPGDNVLSYATRRAASFDVDKDNRNHLFQWMLYATRREPSCLSMFVQHVGSEHSAGRVVPINTIADHIKKRLPREAEAGHTAEVAWLLFLARELKIPLDAILLSQATKLRSSVAAMIALDLRQQGLIIGVLDDSLWAYFAKNDGLESEMWLVAYEATKKGWWTKPKNTRFIQAHKFFSQILEKDINFYDEKRKSRPQVGENFFSMIKSFRKKRKAEHFGSNYD